MKTHFLKACHAFFLRVYAITDGVKSFIMVIGHKHQSIVRIEKSAVVSVTDIIIKIRFVPNPAWRMGELAICIPVDISANYDTGQNLGQISFFLSPSKSFCLFLCQIERRQLTILRKISIHAIFHCSCHSSNKHS